jgi:DNA-binding beta-propeller fold protein YncE
VYVADAGSKSIVVLAPDGGEPPRHLGEGRFTEPAAVAVLRDRTLIAVDAGAGAIIRIDPADGSILGRLIPEVGLYGPRGVGVSPDGRIAIADTGNNRIVIIPPTGAPPEVVGGVREPTDVAFLPDGTLLVAETGAKQITNVKLDGGRIGGWSIPESYTVVGPHVAVLPRGGWVATSPESKSVLRMAPNDRDPKPWSVDGGLRKPVGIAASNQAIVVVDADAATVTRYAIP